ncbi:MAG: DUF2262 domain-containing protein [Gammaproteobacteria bacterium]
MTGDYIDPVFGAMRYDPERETYEAQPLIEGAKIDVTLKAKGSKDRETFLANTRRAWPVLAGAGIEAARAHACDELLSLKNETWLEEGEAPIGAEAFKKRLKLDGITVHLDGACSYLFTDGDLFWGHYVSVWRNADGQFSGADLAG